MWLRAVVVLALVSSAELGILQDIVTIVQSEIRDEACKRDTMLLIQEVQNYTDWALQMVDATAKFPSGVLQGNLRQLGDFDECVTTKGGGGLQGKYCLANLQASPGGPVWERILKNASSGRYGLEITRGRKGPAVFPSLALLEWAICVPATCPAFDVEAVLNAALRRLDLPLDAQVLPEACQLEGNSWPPFSPADYVMLMILIITLLLVISASVYETYIQETEDIKYKRNVLKEIFLAFSAPANWKKLVNTRTTPGTVGCIDGIRTLSTLWVIMTHKLLFLATEPWVNKVALPNAIQDFQKMPLTNSFLNVDTFFVISGLLRSYNVLRELQENRFQYIPSLLQRYLRLSPAYFIVISFYATLLMYIGSGPAWNQTTGANSDYCRENWLLNLLFVNNYISVDRICMLQSWYLAADMQLFIIAPLVIYPLWRWPKIGKVLVAGLLVLSVLLPLTTIILNQYPGLYHVGLSDEKIREYMMNIYFATHNRMSPYLVGLGLGYVLHQMRDCQFPVSRVWVGTGWFLSSVLLIAVVFGPYKMMQLDHSYSMVEEAAYGSLHHLAWALAVAWIVFACHMGQGGPVNSILNASVFRPLSKLSYSMYLTHMAVLLFASSRIRNPIWMDEFLLMYNYLADVGIVLILSAVLFLGYEAPSLAISRIIFRKDRAIQKEPTDVTSGLQSKMNGNAVTARH